MHYLKYDTYRNSGIEWLGDVPSDWKIKRLKYLVSISTGDKDTINRVDNGQYPFFVRSQNVERIDTYGHDEEAVLTAGDGDIGKVFHYINGKFEFHQRVYKFGNFNEINAKYLYYYLHHHLSEEVVKLSAKSTVDSLRLPMLQNFPVLFPYYAQQEKIIEFLDSEIPRFNDGIKRKQKLIILLKEQKAILINQAVTKGLSPGEPMQPSGVEWVGEIPSSWELRKAKYLFRQSNIPVREEDGVVTAFRDGQVTLRSNRRIEGFTNAVLEQGYQGIRIGQLVLNSMDAFAGAIGVSDSDGKCSPEYVICDPVNDREVVPDYFALLLREMALAGYIEVISSAVRQRALRIRFNNLAPLFLTVPTYAEQGRIVEYVSKVSSEIEGIVTQINKEIEKLNEFRQVLISNAVTGKIKI